MDRYAALDDLLQVLALLVDTERTSFGTHEMYEMYEMSWHAQGV
jgi:hypothetical protein